MPEIEISAMTGEMEFKERKRIAAAAVSEKKLSAKCRKDNETFILNGKSECSRAQLQTTELINVHEGSEGIVPNDGPMWIPLSLRKWSGVTNRRD